MFSVPRQVLGKLILHLPKRFKSADNSPGTWKVSVISLCSWKKSKSVYLESAKVLLHLVERLEVPTLFHQVPGKSPLHITKPLESGHCISPNTLKVSTTSHRGPGKGSLRRTEQMKKSCNFIQETGKNLLPLTACLESVRCFKRVWSGPGFPGKWLVKHQEPEKARLPTHTSGNKGIDNLMIQDHYRVMEKTFR